MNSTDHLLTEQRNPATQEIDALPTLEMMRVINREDAKVAEAVSAALPQIAAAIDAIVARMKQGGRLIYVGAGTSGRLGVLDASEIPPTFSMAPGRVIGVMAGGSTAITNSVEAAEDSPEQGAHDLAALELSALDSVMGIAASGRTPYVVGALKYARKLGAFSASVTCSAPSPMADAAELSIVALPGPEVITGSTRLKAGTAQKLILNMISTGVMIRLGKTYGNLMVDVQPSNEKLRQRARRIVAQASGLAPDDAGQLLADCDGEVKTAIVAAKLGVSPAHARQCLAAAGGVVRAAIEDPLMIVIGLMSGTSADGIDAAVVELEGTPPDLRWELLTHLHTDYDPLLRNEIFACFRPETATVNRLCALNFALGRAYAQAAQSAITAAGLTTDQVDLIGSHGQTLWHIPTGPDASTLQLGEPAVIAELTGLPVVSNFRVRDMAAGGQGAPLVSYVDLLLFTHPQRIRALQNIGGIGNVTFVPPSAFARGLAFDTGPGNMLIDDAVRRASSGALAYDDGGRLAAQGRVSDLLLAELMEEPYLRLPPPKTTGRELFGSQYGAQVWQRGLALGLTANDIIATLTAFTAHSIVRSYADFLPQLPDEVIVSGGGAYNRTLLAMLADLLPASRVVTSADLGLPADAKEAVAFAVLAHETWCGRPGNWPPATGAAHPVVLGSITPVG